MRVHTLGNRRDIDGLRALAVIPVVLFHYGISGFSGGFVGVDVFFVISGFLITSIICREIEAGQFSFYDFWSRRARRIIPALSVVMAATLLIGWLLLPADDYSQLGRSVRYQAMFISNILFMRQDGYFNPASDFKPLLHMWSLAVEEQYYIVFPTLMVLITRYLRRWRLVLLALLVLSFGLGVWAVKREPNAAFFLLPMRAWELLCGAMLAVLPSSHRSFRPWLYQVISLAGLLAVVFAVCRLDRYTPFPGWAALLPVLGATAMIWANGQAPTLVGKLLGLRLLVGIGLISYSLYLWHWPILVYANAASIDTLQPWEAAGWILLSVVLAYLCWRFVEAPFREKRLLAGRRPVIVVALLSMLVLAMAGQALRLLDGVPKRMSGDAMRYVQAREWQLGQSECLQGKDSPDLNTVCRFGGDANTPPVQFIWGDSHAAALVPAVRADSGRYDRPVWLASLAGCLPTFSAEVSQQCQDFNRQTLELVRRQKVQDIVLAARWSLYLYGEEDGDRRYLIYPGENRLVAEQRLAGDLRATIATLRGTGARVWLFKEVPLQRQGTIGRLSSLAMIGRPVSDVGRPVIEHNTRQHFIAALFDELSAADPQVRILDPAMLLCAGGICRAAADGSSLYRDESHLSDQGGERMKPLLEPVFLSENGR